MLIFMLTISRCEDVIVKCIHPNGSSVSCCDVFFQHQPFLSMDGVCFTSNPLNANRGLLEMFEKVTVEVKMDKNLYAGKWI